MVRHSGKKEIGYREDNVDAMTASGIWLRRIDDSRLTTSDKRQEAVGGLPCFGNARNMQSGTARCLL